MALLFWADARAQDIALAVDHVAAPGIEVHDFRADLRHERLHVVVGRIDAFGRSWRNIEADCARFEIAAGRLGCRDGRLGDRGVFSLRADLPTRRYVVDFLPAGGGRLRIEGDAKSLVLHVVDGPATLVGGLLPAGLPEPTGGRFDLTARLSRSGQMAARAAFRALAFTDAQGRRAGEHIDGALEFAAKREARRWTWTGRLDLLGGEIYWHPLWLGNAPRRLRAGGSWGDGRIEISGRLSSDDLGEIVFRAGANPKSLQTFDLAIAADALDLTAASALIGPLLAPTPFATLLPQGRAGVRFAIAGGRLETLDIKGHGLRLEDRAGRIALENLDIDLPWRRGSSTTARLNVTGGRLFALPLGPTRIEAELTPQGLTARDLVFPVLDGRLTLERLDLALRNSLEFEAQAFLSPISMESLATALGGPLMHGTLSAVLPRVRYRQGVLTSEGAALFRIFDGEVVLKHLRAEDLFGPAPFVEADVDMRRLDLERITRTFAFGSITGRIDASVTRLALSRWRPVRFDAWVGSSPGEAPRRISQRAVENIAALGGGSGAILRHTFLRIFDEFRYRRLGLGCRLERGICHMRGLADRDGGFLIVEGGGIPALTVIGYNREVDWRELLDRLARIRAGGPPFIR